MNIIKKLDTKEQELAEENVISASLHERYITAREKYDQLIQKQKTLNKYLNAHPLEFTEEYDSLPQNIKELVCIFNSDMPDTDYSPNNTSILLQNTSDLLFTNLMWFSM